MFCFCFGFFSAGLRLESRASSMLSRNQPFDYTLATEVFNATLSSPWRFHHPQQYQFLGRSFPSMLPTLTSALWPWEYYSLASWIPYLPASLESSEPPYAFQEAFLKSFIQNLSKSEDWSRQPLPPETQCPSMVSATAANHSQAKSQLTVSYTEKKDDCYMTRRPAGPGKQAPKPELFTHALLLEDSVTPYSHLTHHHVGTADLTSQPKMWVQWTASYAGRQITFITVYCYNSLTLFFLISHKCLPNL